jgi:glycine dehydrogenase subunit 1
MTIRLALLGKSGFVQVAEQCLAKAQYLRQELTRIDGIDDPHPEAVVFNEFSIRLRSLSSQVFLERLEAQGILAGVPLGSFDAQRADQILIAVTEQHMREDLDRFVQAARAAQS